MRVNIVFLFTAALFFKYGGAPTAAAQCGVPCQMTCFQENPSEIKRALGNSPLLDALLPDTFDYAQAVRDAAAAFPVAGGFFKGSELKGTRVSGITGGVVKVLNACGLMAVAPEKEYIAFKIGFGKLPFPTAAGPDGMEVCAAVQICDGSILLGLRGFKIKIQTPVGPAAIGPTAFGLSLKGGLQETSKAPLWFGGAIATNSKVVNGHLHMAGFLQWSIGEPGILVLNLRADASLIMNLQPSTSAPLVVPSFTGAANSLANMEVLISVSVAPNIEVLNIIRIDLSKFLGSAQASVYLSTLGQGASFEVAVAFVAQVKPFAVLGALGFGDGLTTNVIQELVDDTEIKGALKFFVTHVDGSNKSTKWGLRLEGEANVRSSKRTQNVRDSKINAISISGGSNSRTVIALWNRNNQAVISISLCSSESHCKEDEFCDLTFGACTKKVGRGSICLVDKVCKKRFTCVRGFCNRRCSKGCNDQEFCDSAFNVCAPKVGKGSVCVEDKVCSGNLVCKIGFCNNGCKNDAGCGAQQFCGRVSRNCTNKFGRGAACTGNFQCSSRFTCVRGFCNRQCSKGCNSNEFCDSTFNVCSPKVGKGSVCVEDKVCSGNLVCKTGFCNNGCKNDAACGAQQFCGRVSRNCTNKFGRGAGCTGNFQCSSRFTCVRGFCNRQCSKGCNSNEFCDSTFNVCSPKVGKGSVCVEDKVCSGNLVCKTGFCNNGCKNDAACGEGKYCDRTFRNCNNRVGRGSVCLQSFTCQERYRCHGGFCNRKCNAGCSGGEFCDAFQNCVRKFGKGRPCARGRECRKKCRFFFCT
ncbi:hypothetical protein BSKO_12423 [Bryopsis sp. KO-2023]|nr:hypothetical protein BSKO_12423 [Bryopsis sp. KO-2023]